MTLLWGLGSKPLETEFNFIIIEPNSFNFAFSNWSIGHVHRMFLGVATMAPKLSEVRGEIPPLTKVVFHT